MQTICHALPVVNTIFQVSKKYNKHYCYPSQKRLQALLRTMYGIDRSLSTLNRWLRLVEDEGLIKRVRRINVDPVSGYNFRSTLYFLTLKGLKNLNKCGYDVFDAIKKYYDKIKSAASQRETLAAADLQWQDIYKTLNFAKKGLKVPT